jgi:hypothetical protein
VRDGGTCQGVQEKDFHAHAHTHSDRSVYERGLFWTSE